MTDRDALLRRLARGLRGEVLRQQCVLAASTCRPRGPLRYPGSVWVGPRPHARDTGGVAVGLDGLPPGGVRADGGFPWHENWVAGMEVGAPGRLPPDETLPWQRQEW